MPGDYSRPDVLERIYHNQLALEAAIMELTLWVEQRDSPEVGDNVSKYLGEFNRTTNSSSLIWQILFHAYRGNIRSKS
ncbi:hypothetical protein [Pseudomonas sp. LB3P38]|uniref:hypothetical protein n=1 Tax=Pseudomonas lyxosi TaxID=3398358 RepID=UPI0039EF81D4